MIGMITQVRLCTELLSIIQIHLQQTNINNDDDDDNYDNQHNNQDIQQSSSSSSASAIPITNDDN